MSAGIVIVRASVDMNRIKEQNSRGMKLAVQVNIKDEVRIVWLRDVLPAWVIQSYACVEAPTGLPDEVRERIHNNGSRVVGFAELKEDAIPDKRNKGLHGRRLFILREEDIEKYSGDSYPKGAVVPQSIVAKGKGISPSKKPQIATRIPQEYLWQMNIVAQRAGITETEVILNALKDYLEKEIQSKSVSERVSELESKIHSLEQEVAHQRNSG